MGPFLILFIVQCFFALGVIIVLKKTLDRELIEAAFEKLEACKSSPEVKEIVVCLPSAVSDEMKTHLESIRQRKFVQANLKIQEDPALKGGMVIAVGDLLLDFSLSGRLQHFWS
ncbi:MAG: F0F1 ATP synthase subunit delta [Candidatus Omnitrophica bacterium]|nr:F0F1 ATP synthase subunit delta [Candidatus Omnitrophota bacterium]